MSQNWNKLIGATISIIGGIGVTWSGSYVTALYRALGLLEAGVEGIEIFMTEGTAKCHEYRWVLPLFGSATKIQSFLAESNIEACYPISAFNAMYGHDNHSTWTSSNSWNIYGLGINGL